MHGVISRDAPPLINSIFNFLPPNHRESRAVRHFEEIFTRKLYRIRTISWLGPRLWNSCISPISHHNASPLTKKLIKEITKRQILAEYAEML